MSGPSPTGPPSVLVCRGCCCGTVEEHPDVDHDAQLDQLRAAVPPGGKFWTVDCLGPCAASNVVVVRAGGTRHWFGRVLRTDQTSELASWITDGAPAALPQPLAELTIAPDDIDVDFVGVDITHEQLTDLVGASLGDGIGTWAIGVVGAVGEWFPDPSCVVTRPSADEFVASTDTATLRLRIPVATRAYVGRRRDGTVARMVLAAPPIPVSGVVNDRGDDGNGRLVDLGIGIGSCSFMIRVDDALHRLVAPHLGRPWQELMANVGGEIVAASPPRVVTTNLAEVEIRAPIPPPDGRSPEGSHTHLLPAELELGRELLTGFVIAPGLSAGATFHPAVESKWSLPAGAIVG